MIYNTKIISSYNFKFEYNLYILRHIIRMHYDSFVHRILPFQNMVTPRMLGNKEDLEFVNEELASLGRPPLDQLEQPLFLFFGSS
jgi:hypothetical protein